MKPVIKYALLFACLTNFNITAQAEETMTLDGSTIVGNRELPKALHIVPWKSAEAGDLSGRPMNSLIDEVLAPIDHDVFLRELEFYEVVHNSDTRDQ